MKHAIGAILAALAIAVPAAYAHDHSKAKAGDSTTQAQAAMSEGEVRNVDKSQGKVTVKHGEIKNLEMPPMTMVFRVKDAALLDKVKEGDKIKFSAEKVEGNITITQIETAGQKH